jgi:hypothetical protein
MTSRKIRDLRRLLNTLVGSELLVDEDRMYAYSLL